SRGAGAKLPFDGHRYGPRHANGAAGDLRYAAAPGGHAGLPGRDHDLRDHLRHHRADGVLDETGAPHEASARRTLMATDFIRPGRDWFTFAAARFRAFPASAPTAPQPCR